MAKKIPEINASSMADISFLLLIFFLVTTSMDVNKGLQRRLPPPMEKDKKIEDSEINKREILEIKINWENGLFVEGEPFLPGQKLSDNDDASSKQNNENIIKELKQLAKDHINPKVTGENLPVTDTLNLPAPFGVQNCKKKHVISLQCDSETSYQAYLLVQDALVAAYNELRNDCAMEFYGRPYIELAKENKHKSIDKIYPMKISEAEPKSYGGK